MEDEVNVALKKISHANNAFAFDIYKVLAAERGNLFFSPISLQVLFALTYQGARGNTAKQIASGLRFPEDRAVVEDGFAAIMNRLYVSNDVVLVMVNMIVMKQGFVIKEEFKQSAVRLMTIMKELDFMQEVLARKTANDCVEKKTNNDLKDVNALGVMNDQTPLILLNVIYFKGDWLKKFRKNDTSHMPFHSACETADNVDMMFLAEEFKYTVADELNCQVLLLPYKGERHSMMVFLPREVNGLAILEENLANINLQDIINKMHESFVHVYLPKFYMERSEEFREVLKTLGLTDMFDDDACNLSGISDERLNVDTVLHTTSVEVNEEGTKAPALASFKVTVCCADYRPPTPIVFRADHPFVFLILDQQTESVLFMGRYSDALSPIDCNIFKCALYVIGIVCAILLILFGKHVI